MSTKYYNAKQFLEMNFSREYTGRKRDGDYFKTRSNTTVGRRGRDFDEISVLTVSYNDYGIVLKGYIIRDYEFVKVKYFTFY